MTDKVTQKQQNLEFQMTLDELKRNLKAGEVEVTAEQKGLQMGMAPEDLIQRHEVSDNSWHIFCVSSS